MKNLKHPAKSLYQNELNLEDEMIASEEDDYISIQKKENYFVRYLNVSRGVLFQTFVSTIK